MGSRKEWEVSWWRGSLPRFPLRDEPEPPAWEGFPLEHFGTELEALAFAEVKIRVGYGAEVEAPNGERLDTVKILRRLSVLA